MDVLDSDYLTCGPRVEEFEEAFAAVCNAKHAVAVSSGTAALHLAYLAVGIGPGHRVLIPPISFVATANAALYTGAEVEFAPEEVSVADHERWLEGEGDVPFHVFVTLGGDPYPNNVGFQWSPERAILDACHGPFELPGGYAAACFSLHPAKHIAAGEGGVIGTNCPLLDVKWRQARSHGRVKTQMWHMGFNYRLDEMSAALALSQLSRLGWNIYRRRELAARYDSFFEDKVETVPHSPDSARHLYQILVDDRDRIQVMLREKGVMTAVHYPLIPLQPYYRERFGYKPGQWPNAERFAARTLSIPLYPTLTAEEQDHVINSVLEVTSDQVSLV